MQAIAGGIRRRRAREPLSMRTRSWQRDEPRRRAERRLSVSRSRWRLLRSNTLRQALLVQHEAELIPPRVDDVSERGTEAEDEQRHRIGSQADCRISLFDARV